MTIRIIMYIFSNYGKNEIVLFPEMIIRELCLNSQCILKTSRVCITVRKIINLKSPYFSVVFSKSTNFERISLLTDYSRFKWVNSFEFAPIRRYEVLQMTNKKLLLLQLSVVQNAVNISEAEDRAIIFTRSKLHWLPGSTPREWGQQKRKMWVYKFLDRNYLVCFDSRTIAAPVIKLSYFQ